MLGLISKQHCLGWKKQPKHPRCQQLTWIPHVTVNQRTLFLPGQKGSRDGNVTALFTGFSQPLLSPARSFSHEIQRPAQPVTATLTQQAAKLSRAQRCLPLLSPTVTATTMERAVLPLPGCCKFISPNLTQLCIAALSLNQYSPDPHPLSQANLNLEQAVAEANLYTHLTAATLILHPDEAI